MAQITTPCANFGENCGTVSDLAVRGMARTRLGHLKTSLKDIKHTPDVKLGVYEQNLGLKYGSPRRLLTRFPFPSA